jgi:hypothetical protein
LGRNLSFGAADLEILLKFFPSRIGRIRSYLCVLDFDFPESFLLLPLLVLVGWFCPKLGLFRPLCVVALLLWVAMLSGPKLIEH